MCDIFTTYSENIMCKSSKVRLVWSNSNINNPINIYIIIINTKNKGNNNEQNN